MATRKRTLDFTGVETFEKLPEGYYAVKIARVKETRSQGGNDMFRIAFQVVKGTHKGSTIFDNYPLIESALWKLKSLLQAIGMKADGRVQIDLDKMVGKNLEICVVHEEYNGQMRAKISETSKTGTNNISDTTAKKAENDDLDEEFDDEEETDAVDDFDDEEDQEEPEEDQEEEDEPEEPEPPKKRRGRKKKEPEESEPPKKRGRKKKEPEPEPEPEEDEETADFDDEDDEELDDFEDFDEE